MEEQHRRFLEDLATYGTEVTGTYKGIKWVMTRPRRTHWNGYVSIKGHIDNRKMALMEKYAHTGFSTALGFDCASYCDYYPGDIGDYPGYVGQRVYRDYNYVLGCIQNIIDCYLLPVQRNTTGVRRNV